MSFQQIKSELDHHLDRIRDSTAKMLNVVVNDPRLEADQRGELLVQLIREHKYVAAFMEDGLVKAIEARDKKELNLTMHDH
jgi:hypothetical protein